MLDLPNFGLFVVWYALHVHGSLHGYSDQRILLDAIEIHVVSNVVMGPDSWPMG